MNRKLMHLVVALLTLWTVSGAGLAGAQAPTSTPDPAGTVAPTGAPTDDAGSGDAPDSVVLPDTWLPYTDSGSAFMLWYPPRWTPAPKQVPGSPRFNEGESKSVMLAVFPSEGRDLDGLLRQLLSTTDQGRSVGLDEEVVTSGSWLHGVPGKYGRVALVNKYGELGERLIVLGSLDQRTFVLGLIGNLPGQVDEQDEGDLARLIDSIRLLGPDSEVTPIAQPAPSSKD